MFLVQEWQERILNYHHIPIDTVVIELFPLLFFQKSNVCLLLILINLILENVIEFYLILGFILGILVGLVLVW